MNQVRVRMEKFADKNLTMVAFIETLYDEYGFNRLKKIKAFVENGDLVFYQEDDKVLTRLDELEREVALKFELAKHSFDEILKLRKKLKDLTFAVNLGGVVVGTLLLVMAWWLS